MVELQVLIGPTDHPGEMSDFAGAAAQLVQAGRRFDARGWVLGTSGNLSVVLGRDPLRLAITRSGAEKGELTPDASVTPRAIAGLPDSWSSRRVASCSSDVPSELDAAREAEMATGLVIRPGNAPVADTDAARYRFVRSFDEL